MSPAAIREALAAEIAPWLAACGCYVDPAQVLELADDLIEAGPIGADLTRRDLLAARLVAADIFDEFSTDEKPTPEYGQPGRTGLDIARKAYRDVDELHRSAGN